MHKRSSSVGNINQTHRSFLRNMKLFGKKDVNAQSKGNTTHTHLTILFFGFHHVNISAGVSVRYLVMVANCWSETF